MAFSTAQKADIRYYLGWTPRFVAYDSRLEWAMDTVGADSDAQALVLADIVKLQAIDTQLSDALTRTKALAVDSITLPGEKEILILRAEGRRLVGRLAATLGVAPFSDVYGSAAPGFFAARDWTTNGGYYPSEG